MTRRTRSIRCRVQRSGTDFFIFRLKRPLAQPKVASFEFPRAGEFRRRFSSSFEKVFSCLFLKSEKSGRKIAAKVENQLCFQPMLLHPRSFFRSDPGDAVV